MYMNIGNLSADMDSIVANSKLEEMINLAFGDKIDDDTAERIAASFFDSIIVETLYKEQKSYWGRQYWETANDKSKRAEIEDTAKDAIAEFLSYFDDIDNIKLTRAIKKKFRYYRFKEINRVNDYTILYFTYKLFGICRSEFAECSVDEAAVRFAQKASERLKGKRQTTVTCDNLISYLKGFDLANPKRTYIEIFIEYIRDVYFSGMDDVNVYAIFSRFAPTIVLINCILTFFTAMGDTNINSVEPIEYSEPQKISKYVSNQKRSLKNGVNDDAAEVKSISDELQRVFGKMPKTSDRLHKITKQQYCQACITICDSIYGLLEHKDGAYGDVVSKIISAYRHLSFKGENGEVGIYEQVFKGALDYAFGFAAKGARKKINKHYLGGNIFLQLLFSGMVIGDEKTADRFNKISDETIEFAAGKLKNKLSFNIDAEIKAYQKIRQYVDLDIMKPAVLDLNLSECTEYDMAVSCLENVI